MDESVNE